jgi:hypothetical protein
MKRQVFKKQQMPYKKIAILLVVVGFLSFAGYQYTFFVKNANTPSTIQVSEKACCSKKAGDKSVPKGCVFRTLFKEESADGFMKYETPENVQLALDKSLKWAIEAQHENGGWGAGLRSKQQVLDPHAVQTDPATTSMVGMALLRTGSTLVDGEYANALLKATKYLLKEIEETKKEVFITTKRGTQIQGKLGENIDAVITVQFLSNLLTKTDDSHELVAVIKIALDICVQKIQSTQDEKGRTAGGSWAGVLQSSMANAALESAEANGASIDEYKLAKAKEYQEENYDPSTGTTNAADGAGIMLYSMSSSVRASAKNARKVREEVEEAKESNKIAADAPVTTQTLVDLGYSNDDAIKMNTSYQVYESAKTEAQTDRVMNGFGNNGGEEFISFLQTGESMVVGGDDTWKTWYDNVSAKMLAIQNADGSWNGHHCITSPSFCTATCILILSINNDAEMLSALGESKQ